MSDEQLKESAKGTDSPAKISLHVALPELLQKRRNELGYSLKDVEKAINVREIYLGQIEAGDYDKLPDDVYAKGYVKNYADYLGFDTKPIMQLYTNERVAHKQASADSHSRQKSSGFNLKPIGSGAVVVTPKAIAILIGVATFVIAAGYILWQFVLLAAPPKINLNSQIPGTVNTSYIIVSGQIDAGSDLFINSSPVQISPDGSFSERIAVEDGDNTITLMARNKLGKTSTMSKNIVARLPNSANADLASQLPANPVDGVQIVIKVNKQATWIVAKADGQDAFHGTMLPGSQQLIKAKQSITLTTGNGGATSVVITNSSVARKNLGQLGRDGEAKIDLTFNKDTQFSQ
ncbi:DUF4115 domain-containing protein [Candidatus Saccharibacteria bacterium]|nr:DUF4115 domain-containing protein [Candidatus Saccharibacteria bacterium]